ncbi:MAG: elongation factor G, partial [Chloroflexi bacterium]
MIPVLCGAGSKNIAVQTLLDAVVDYLPAADALPEDAKAFDDTLSMFVYKTAAAQVGTISYFRVYSGTLKPDTHVYNVQTKADERIGQLITTRGKTQEPATEVPAGDFGAVTKL